MNEVPGGEPTESPRPLEFFAVDFSQFQHFPTIDADAVRAEVDRIAEQFTVFGARRATAWAVPPADRGFDATAARLRAWQESPARSTVLYWLGHGLSDSRRARLALAGSANDVNDPVGLVAPEQLAGFLHLRDRDLADEDRWALVLIDACKSELFVKQLVAALDELGGPGRVMVIASSPPRAPATLNRLGDALSSVITGLLSVPEISLLQFGEAVKCALDDVGCLRALNVSGLVLTNARALPDGMKTTLDHAHQVSDAMAALPAAEREHFQTLAAGGELGTTSWSFSGRRPELERLAAWNRGTSPLLVVTGGAGSGKSALLGTVLLRSSPELWAAIRRLPLDADPDDDDLALPTVQGAVRLTGASISSTITDLAARLTLGTPPQGAESEQVEWLTGRLRPEPGQTLLLDGLDEAVDPEGVTALVGALVAAGCRLLVGTRRSVASQWGEPEPEVADLVERLQVTVPSAEVVQLERDPDGQAAYARRRLQLAIDGGRSGLRHRIDAAVAQLREAPDFLFTRLALLELTADPTLIDVDWVGTAATDGPQGLFRQALRRLTAQNPRFPTLLRALAERRGCGMPTELGVWLAAARGIAGDEPPSAADLDELLSDAGAPYLMVDRELDHTAFRLAHRAFEHELQEQPSSAPRTPPATDLRLALATALIELAAGQRERLSSYLHRHLADHVRSAGLEGWRRLLDQLLVLDALDPDSVVVAALRTDFADAPIPPELAILIGARYQLRTADPGDRPGLRQIARARFGGGDERPGAIGPGAVGPGAVGPGAWTVHAARLRRRTPHLLLQAGAGGIRSLAAYTDPDGAPRVVAGTTLGTVRVTDPLTGLRLVELAGHQGSVRAVVALGAGRTGPVPRRQHLISAGEDGQLILWTSSGAPGSRAGTWGRRCGPSPP